MVVLRKLDLPVNSVLWLLSNNVRLFSWVDIHKKTCVLSFSFFLPYLTLKSSRSGSFQCFRQSCIWATWPTRSSPQVGKKGWKWDHQRSSPRSPICSRWPFSLLPCVSLWALVYASQRWLWRLPSGQGGAAGGGADQEENGDSQRQANPLLQPAWGIQQLSPPNLTTNPSNTLHLNYSYIWDLNFVLVLRYNSMNSQSPTSENSNQLSPLTIVVILLTASFMVFCLAVRALIYIPLLIAIGHSPFKLFFESVGLFLSWCFLPSIRPSLLEIPWPNLSTVPCLTGLCCASITHCSTKKTWRSRSP